MVNTVAIVVAPSSRAGWLWGGVGSCWLAGCVVITIWVYKMETFGTL